MTPDQDLRALDGMDGGPVTVMVGDQTFKMAPLMPADYIEAARWRAEQKVSSLLSSMPTNPLMDVTAIKAEAIASVLSKSVSPWDLLGDIEGVCRLAEIALQRGGEFKGNFEGFKRGITKTTYQDLERAVLKVSGFKLPERKKAEGDAVSANPQVPIFTT